MRYEKDETVIEQCGKVVGYEVTEWLEVKCPDQKTEFSFIAHGHGPWKLTMWATYGDEKTDQIP